MILCSPLLGGQINWGRARTDRYFVRIMGLTGISRHPGIICTMFSKAALYEKLNIDLPATQHYDHMDRVKRIWYLSSVRAAKVQASLRIRAVSPEPSLLAHTSSESRGTFRQKARSLAPLNGWACAVKICHDGMLEDTNSLEGAHMATAYCHFDNVPLSPL